MIASRPTARKTGGSVYYCTGVLIKISNGHISATDHPIDFVFDSRVGFSGTVDQMDLLPTAPNQRGGCPLLENFE